MSELDDLRREVRDLTQRCQERAHYAAGTSPRSPRYGEERLSWRAGLREEVRHAARDRFDRTRPGRDYRRVRAHARDTRSRWRRNPAGAVAMLVLRQPIAYAMSYVRFVLFLVITLLLLCALIWWALAPVRDAIGMIVPGSFQTASACSNTRPQGGIVGAAWGTGNTVRTALSTAPSEDDIRQGFRSAARATGQGWAMLRAGLEGAEQPLEPRPEVSTVPSTFACGSAECGPAVSGDAGSFIASIVEQESGGSYSAVGPATRYGHAYGKYQVLETNIGPWSEQYLGRRVTVREFHQSPDVQDAIAVARLTELHAEHGPRGAAAAWYSGDPDAHMSTAPQSGGPSIRDYVDSVLARVDNPTHTVQAADLGTGGCGEGTWTSASGVSGEAGPWGGHSNGMIPASELCRVPGAPAGEKGLLRCDAARSWEALSAAFQAGAGAALPFGNGYRSYQRQVELRAEKGRWAAEPGTSTHGWGLAVDVGGPAGRFGTAEHEWLRANAGRFGWHHPHWAREGGNLPEPWHWEFGAGEVTVEAG